MEHFTLFKKKVSTLLRVNVCNLRFLAVLLMNAADKRNFSAFPLSPKAVDQPRIGGFVRDFVYFKNPRRDGISIVSGPWTPLSEWQSSRPQILQGAAGSRPPSDQGLR